MTCTNQINQKGEVMKKADQLKGKQVNTKLEVLVEGRAYRITAYIVNNKILKQIEKLSDEDAEYEDNKYSAVGMNCLHSIRIASGFYTDDLNGITWSVRLNGVEQEIADIGCTYEGCDFADLFDAPREKVLIGSHEKILKLGINFVLKRGQFYIFEVEDIKFATGKISETITGEVKFTDIELGIIDLDADTELATAVQGAGILNGSELDIRTVHCNGGCYEFEYDVLKSYPSRFYVARKSKRGNGWECEFLG